MSLSLKKHNCLYLPQTIKFKLSSKTCLLHLEFDHFPILLQWEFSSFTISDIHCFLNTLQTLKSYGTVTKQLDTKSKKHHQYHWFTRQKFTRKSLCLLHSNCREPRREKQIQRPFLLRVKWIFFMLNFSKRSIEIFVLLRNCIHADFFCTSRKAPYLY